MLNVRRIFLLSLACLALAGSLCLWPIDFMEIQSSEGRVLALPLRSGQAFVARYIHSVELTPVEDEYRVVGGRLWVWEERVQSHNAGLPFEAPRNGRFIMDPPWMRVQGGRLSLGELFYRVGNAEYGKNEWSFPPFPPVAIHQLYPGKRMALTVKKLPLAEALQSAHGEGNLGNLVGQFRGDQ